MLFKSATIALVALSRNNVDAFLTPGSQHAGGRIISSSSSSSFSSAANMVPFDVDTTTTLVTPLQQLEKLSTMVSTQLSEIIHSHIHMMDDIDSIMLWQKNNVPELQKILDFATHIVLANAIVDPSFRLDESIATFLTTPWHSLAIGIFAMSNAIGFWIQSPDNNEEAPYEPGTTTYDPQAAADFYNQRPILVLKRILKLALLTGAFNTGILFDWLVLGKLLGKGEDYSALQNAEPRRAKESLMLCQQLGPTFIKLGQALSIRTDLIPEAYALELRQLQDAVPPFDSQQARQVLKTQLGVSSLDLIFETLSDEPVASASIGQVYRGTLRGNNGPQEVAVKVQRPGILSDIALDLHVLRTLTPLQTRLSNAINGVPTSQEDIYTALLLVDEWGRGFVAETDYRLEATNTIQFEKAMRDRELEAVCAPRVVPELVRDTVLVTEWVEGTRLDRDVSPDVPRLCGVAINAYLTMLLDTGVLHCDPHPGNLLRTTDGRLCILDWGMTLEVPSDLQYALLEFIAHINVEEYDAIPQDFINLGFSPDGVSADKLKASGVTEGLSFAFRQLSAGGGPTKIQERVKAEFQERYGSTLSDTELQQAARTEMLERMEEQLASEGVDVKGVTNIMEEMSRRNRELFALPPYVLYVARAFSTLEGIGLSIDENYAIVQECYPYLARRLFTDRSPRAKMALKAMLGLSTTEDNEEEEEEGEDYRMLSTTGGDDNSSALAVVQAGTAAAAATTATTSSTTTTTTPPSNNNNKAGGALSPAKLIEMSEGFASYTAATADVDRDGAGQSAAATEFAKLLLDPKGSTLQDILVDETARLGDAATRAALRAALVDSAAAKAAATVLRTPKNIVENSPLSNVLPSTLKDLLVDRPADLPLMVEQLVALNAEDERVLSSAQELQEALVTMAANANNNQEETKDETAVEMEDNNNNGIRSALASQLSDGASFLPSIPSPPPLNSMGDTVNSVLSDPQTRETLTDQVVPGVAALGRRVGAGLLRRAAYRADKSLLLPEETRKALSNANTALADAIDYTSTEEEEEGTN